MDYEVMIAAIDAEISNWRDGLTGGWPPKKITKQMRAVAKALCRAERQPGLWAPEEIERSVRKEWKRYLWQAAVALHAS